jgi:hypothetical protein
VFGGMLAATVFGVFLIPVLYVVIQKMSDRLTKRSDKEPKEDSYTAEENINEGQGI